MSFTEAAAELHISQPAVSRQMAALETEMGTLLFSRDHSAISLTPAGAYLYHNLLPILHRLENVMDETRNIGTGGSGQLKLGLLEDQALDSQISTALRSMKEQNYTLILRRYGFRQLEDALLTGDLDAAVSIEQGIGAFPGCKRRIYADESMCLAVHKALAPWGNETVETILAELERCQIPVLIPGLEAFPPELSAALRTLAGSGWRSGQTYEFSAIAPMVAAGLAATIANETHNLSVDRNILMYAMAETPRVRKGVFWLEDNRNPAIPLLLHQFSTQI